jgi:hypothetical protein
MRIDMKWLIIGAVVFIIVIALGRNPIKEAREAREEAKKGGDPLIQAIEEHNANSGMRSTFSPQMQEGPGASIASPSGSSNFGNTRSAPPDYMIRPEGRGNYEYQPPVVRSTPPDSNSYYPPPPLNQAAPNQLGPRSYNGPRLSDGRPVAFAGTDVYTYDSEGNKISMPDGTYYMYDGAIKVVVQDGRQIRSSN